MIAVVFQLNLNYITYFMRMAIFVIPVLVFFLARRWCISLQRHDQEKLLHGYETGIIMRSPEGGYSERHLPINDATAYTLTARDRDRIHTPPSTVDGNGVPAPGSRIQALRAKLSEKMYGHNVQKPTREELEEGHHHTEHEQELQAGLDHPADGHQFDGHHAVEGEELRSH